MEILLSCPICFKADGNPLVSIFTDYLKNEEFGEYTCKRGHKFYAISSKERYQFMFDYAIKLLQEGNLTTSILMSYTALESFMTFFIKLNLFMDGKDFDDIEDFFKDIKKIVSIQVNNEGYITCLSQGAMLKNGIDISNLELPSDLESNFSSYKYINGKIKLQEDNKDR